MSALDDWARALLRCPACGAPLDDVDAEGAPMLVCQAPEHHAFPVRDGIPVLLVDEMVTGPVGD